MMNGKVISLSLKDRILLGYMIDAMQPRGTAVFLAKFKSLKEIIRPGSDEEQYYKVSKNGNLAVDESYQKLVTIRFDTEMFLAILLRLLMANEKGHLTELHLDLWNKFILEPNI
jgi:hypothetical protein